MYMEICVSISLSLSLEGWAERAAHARPLHGLNSKGGPVNDRVQG